MFIMKRTVAKQRRGKGALALSAILVLTLMLPQAALATDGGEGERSGGIIQAVVADAGATQAVVADADAAQAVVAEGGAVVEEPVPGAPETQMGGWQIFPSSAV
jgi:hypothetical protein